MDSRATSAGSISTVRAGFFRFDVIALMRISAAWETLGCEQSCNLVLPKCLRLDPTVLESLLDLRQRRPVRKLAEFGLDSAGDADFAELALEQIGRPMIARFEIGEVLLATSIGNVLRQLRLAVVPGDASLPHHFAESHSIHLGEFGGLTQR